MKRMRTNIYSLFCCLSLLFGAKGFADESLNFFSIDELPVSLSAFNPPELFWLELERLNDIHTAIEQKGGRGSFSASDVWVFFLGSREDVLFIPTFLRGLYSENKNPEANSHSRGFDVKINGKDRKILAIFFDLDRYPEMKVETLACRTAAVVFDEVTPLPVADANSLVDACK